MAVLTELRNYVRSGDVSIVGSRQHKNFDEYLVPKENWTRIEPGITKRDKNKPDSPKRTDYPACLNKFSLSVRFPRFVGGTPY